MNLLQRRPPKDRPFPAFAIDYFAQLEQQYELLLADSGRTPLKPIADLLAKVQAAPDQTTWADVFALESAYIYALPLYRLATEVVSMRWRFRGVAGNSAYLIYMQTAQPDVGKMSADELRSEMLTLAERIRYLYTFVPPKENIRNRLAQDAAWLTVIVFALSQAVSITCIVRNWNMPTILLVTFAGVLGGFLSVQARLQAPDTVDPLAKELQLREGWFSVVVLAPLSGAIFAMVLYWLFLGNLLSGGLFPKFGALQGQPTDSLWNAFVLQSSPDGVADYGKLLVWSFVAGFAERFVPNVLTRLAGQASTAPTPPQAPKMTIGAEAAGTDISKTDASKADE